MDAREKENWKEALAAYVIVCKIRPDSYCKRRIRELEAKALRDAFGNLFK